MRRVVNYYRRPWKETRGDAFDSWGESMWFFEVDDLGNVTRQVEQYDNGTTLGYGPDLEQDAWGFLTFEALDLAEFEPYRIEADEFEAAWSAVLRPQRPDSGE